MEITSKPYLLLSSGNPQPSPEDIEVTQRLQEAGLIIGIELVDHIIIGNHNYVSLKEKGYLT
ncbi:DNA repair protein RadC [Lysinibacillus sp. BF-4]|nr:DNA repair protein RadC [Lysinibacillus sp. BF-4]